ncbi:MAG: hypothetical protein IKO47_05080 [Ruminococcus sp.]|nr:hypothetical protein [Ruminococcus sp.]
MKRFVSFIVAAAMTAASVGNFAVSSAGSKDTDKDMVLFGDSISAGYSVDNSLEYNYGEICADYLGGNLNNYAVSGATSDDLIKVIDSLSAEKKENVKNAEYIVISVGGNDLMHYAAKFILNFGAENNLLKEGFTAADIPDEPGISTLLTMLDTDKLRAYASDVTRASELIAVLKNLCNNLMVKTSKYEGVIPEKIIPNIKTAAAKLKAINPNARIIVQTIYQPVEFEKSYLTKNYGSSASIYTTLFGHVRTNFGDVLNKFRKDLKAVDGIEVADVLYNFDSLKDDEIQNNDNPGHSAYFTNLQMSGSARDFHPNQKGHLTIASTVLETIGDLHDDTGLLSKIYKGLLDSSSFPLIALDTYKKVAGNLKLGDVNFDEKIDARDASLILKSSAYLASDPPVFIISEYQKKVVNVNQDETLCDAKDASSVLRYAAFLAINEDVSIEDFLAGKTGK